MSARPDISVIVLNWREPDRARRALLSAEAAFGGLTYELIAVENGSSGHVDLEGLPPAATTRVVLDSNVGVSRGRNAGIAASTGRYVMVLDDDAEMLSGGCELLEFADRHDHAAVIGPRIVASNGELMFTCRRFPTLFDKLNRRIDTEWGRRSLSYSELRDWDHREPALVDYVIGACQLVRREALESIGPYDPSSFYGPEDVDLCLRSWLTGWTVAYFPGTVVLHDERRATRRFSALTMKHGSALARYYLKHRYILARSRLYRRMPGRTEQRGDLLTFRGTA